LWRSLIYTVLVMLVIGECLVLWQRQRVADWWVLRSYSPSGDIVALTNNTTMTDLGKRLFYINRPALENSAEFNKHCAENVEKTAVLGCYHGDRGGIFIYDVTDTRLYGVEQVTAAHEMLHQAYDRLSNEDRKAVDALLSDYYATVKDKEMLSKMAAYQKSEPGAFSSEEFSVFGSEVPALPGKLETYYKKYFGDRGKVVSYAQAYQAEFTRRKELADNLESQLSSLKPRIERMENDLTNRQKTLNDLERTIEKDQASHDVSGYREDVATYNNMATAYNADVDTLKSLIEQYNSMVGRLREIATEQTQLYKALDSRISNVNSQ
jgi:predicted  nucleic acid-binding Zn-ribbon protein